MLILRKKTKIASETNANTIKNNVFISTLSKLHKFEHEKYGSQDITPSISFKC